MIPDKESLTIEFKSDKLKIPDSAIFEAVVALTNTGGGDIYLGVENDGVVTGVHEAHRNPVTLGAYIANHTVPPIPIKTEVLVVGEVNVVKISVPKSHGGIAATVSGKILRRRLKLDGTPENTPMYPMELSTRLSDLRLLDYSAMPVSGASIDDFDPLETERLRKTISSYEGDNYLSELQDEDLFKALGFVRDMEGRLAPTITGLLMIGRSDKIAMFIPTHTATIQVIEGSSVKVNEDIVLPLLAVIEKIDQYINARNSESELDIGLYRMSIPDFNKRAIRESVVNAFSHRDYTRLGRVRVCIADEGLTVSNPGGFIEGVTIHNLLAAEPQGRNPLLADALKRVGLAEKSGRGIDRIFEGSLLYGKRPPDYSASTTTTVSLLIPRCTPDLQLTRIIANEMHKTGRPLSIHTLLVVNALRDAPRSNVRQLSTIANLSEATLWIVLEQAMKTGIVEADGSNRNKRYRLSGKLYSSGKNTVSHLSENLAGYVSEKKVDGSHYQEMILNLASSQDYISRADVMNLLQISAPSAYRTLKKLSEEGRIELVHKGRHSKYRYSSRGVATR